MKIKLVIFDLDGVLVDACEWHRIALNSALKEVCDYEISLTDHYSEYNGIPTKIKLEKLYSKNIVKKEDFEKIELLKQKYTIEIIQKNAFLRKEKIELLNYLKNKNVKIACYTNSIRMTAELMLEKTGILNLFDYIVTNQDVKLAKPDPEGYNKCMKYFDVLSSECVIVEDSPKGIEAAKKSGAFVLEVKNQEFVCLETFLEENFTL